MTCSDKALMTSGYARYLAAKATVVTSTSQPASASPAQTRRS